VAGRKVEAVIAKRTFAAAVVSAALGGVILAQSNPLVGTWKLNVEKSKAPYKSGTTVVEPAGDGVKLTVDLTGTDGTAHHWEITAQYDGKDYPSTGTSPYGDSSSFKRVDARTTEITNKYHGKVINTQRIVVSADGKTRTTTTKGTDVKGQKIDAVSFYEKQ
jgi:hypothetical protein